MNFGDRLKGLRNEKHISQEELADILGVSRQTISRWESSQTTPDLFYLEKICEYFSLSYDELLLKKKKEKQMKFPVILTFLFVMMIIISFFLPHSTEDFAGSAVIITPAGFCLFAGCSGLLLSLYLVYRNHRS